MIDRALQTYGSLGLLLGHASRGDVPRGGAARIYDGPDEVHRQTVARHALKGYQPSEVPTEHIPTRATAAREKFAGMLEFLETEKV